MTAGAAARQPRDAAGRRWWHGHRRLVSTTASLLGATGITSVLGLAFWWLAAHLVSVSALGYGSAAVSALTLVGTFGMAGLNTVLMGRPPGTRGEASGLLSASLCASGLISAALAACFWLAGVVFAPRLAPYLGSAGMAALFIAGSALTAAALVLDEALLGLLGSSFQLWRNTTFALAKLAALAGLALLWHDQFGASILVAWTAGTAVSLLPVAALTSRRGVRLTAAPQWRSLRRLGRASLANTWLNNALQAPRLALPMLVTALVSAAAGGAFFVPWLIVTLITLLPFHFTTALYAVAAGEPRELAAKLGFTLRICLAGGLAGVPLVIVCAHPLLEMLGPTYAARATVPLQLLSLGYFASVVTNHYVSLCRISRQITRAAVFATVAAVAQLAAAAAGGAVGGLTGLSLALLIVMCVEGGAALPTVWAALRGRPYGPPAARRRPVGEGGPALAEAGQAALSPSGSDAAAAASTDGLGPAVPASPPQPNNPHGGRHGTRS